MPIQNVLKYNKQLFQSYALYRVSAFSKRSFPPETLYKVIDELKEKSSGLFIIHTVGQSSEGGSIQIVKAGSGKISILLWSQMHGDESTATMAICDILNYLSTTRTEKTTRKILTTLTLHFLPMLNPDGATRFQRRTAQSIDMNRDALALQTPEARILKHLQKKIHPQFGFNLHDQELSTVGSSKKLAAIGLLAPSFDHAKSNNKVNSRAKYLASVFAMAVNKYIPGKITKYDDSFEPRAFGDNMQKWGTSTLLVESGHVRDDSQKDFIRKLNYIGILTALYAIATGKYKKFDKTVYENLPFNGKRAYDVIIRNVQIEHASGERTKADLGISYQVDTHSELPPKLVDVGDLHTFVGLKEVEGKGRVIQRSLLFLNQVFEWEKYCL